MGVMYRATDTRLGRDYEILSALGAGGMSSLGGLRVASRTSSIKAQANGLEVAEIGQKLNVATVLEGSVRKSGARIRVLAQLTNVGDGYQLWAERFDRDLKDVFAVQDEIARAIATHLKIKLLDATETLERPPTTNIEANDRAISKTHSSASIACARYDARAERWPV